VHVVTPHQKNYRWVRRRRSWVPGRTACAVRPRQCLVEVLRSAPDHRSRPRWPGNDQQEQGGRREPTAKSVGVAPDGKSERCLAPRRVIDVFGEVHTEHLKRRAKDSQAARLLPQVSITLAIEGMETVGEIRRQNLEKLVSDHGTLEAVAQLAGSSSVYLSQVRNRTLDTETERPREMGGRMARRIEAGVGKPAGWMDTPHPELEAVGTTPEKTSTETTGAGVTEVTESAPMSPTDARDISPQSAPETEIPTFMSYSKPRLHSTICFSAVC